MNELRTVVIRAYGHPLKQDKFDEVIENYKYLSKLRVDFDVFTINDELLDNLRGYYEPRFRNKYQTKNADDVAFLMINQDDAKLEENLDGIRERQHKFICLNDNIDHDSPKAKEAVRLIHNFYNSLVPNRCDFELPGSQRNSHQYIDDIYKR